MHQEVCGVCSKSDNLSRCSSCKSVYYCSTDCQKADWKNHKPKCQEIQSNLEREKLRAERKAKGIKSIEDYSDGKLVGTGNFSEIHCVKEIDTNQIFALKRIDKRRLAQVNKEKDILMEKHCLGKLVDNPYVIRLYSTFQDEFNLYILMEYVDGGELWNDIHAYGAGSATLIQYYFAKITQALNSIHQLGIVHRDIKSENILLTQDKNIKFIDFGTARDMLDDTIEGSGNGRKGKKAFKHFVGTPQFMPPECIHNTDSNYKSDVYSLGVLLFQIVYGKFPYEGNSEYLIFSAALETEFTFPEGWLDNEHLRKLLRRMMDKNLQTRISMEELMADEYWGPDWNWDNIPTYQQAIDSMSELDRNTFQVIKEMKLAEKQDIKLQLEHDLRSIIKKYRTEFESPEMQTRLDYIEQQSKVILSKMADDDEPAIQQLQQ